MKKSLFILFILHTCWVSGQQKLGVLKYDGGGDWYANPTALKNLAIFCNTELNTQLSPDFGVVKPNETALFDYAFVHMTGHGNVVFSDEDIENLRSWLFAGGFLHIDDNYGMDQFIRPQLKRLFPEYSLVPLSVDHLIYNLHFKFPKGLPKIHAHDQNPPEGLAIIHEGRVLIYYTYETDLGDGWEDPEVHNDPPEKRRTALELGANLVLYAITE